MPLINESQGNAVGVGVELYDGRETLQTLRLIKNELVAISNLRINSTGSGRNASTQANKFGPDAEREYTAILQRESTKRTSIRQREETHKPSFVDVRSTQEKEYTKVVENEAKKRVEIKKKEVEETKRIYNKPTFAYGTPDDTLHGPFLNRPDEVARYEARLAQQRVNLVTNIERQAFADRIKQTREHLSERRKVLEKEFQEFTRVYQKSAVGRTANSQNFRPLGSNGGGPPNNPFGGGDNGPIQPRQFNDKGFFSTAEMTGRIVRNILLYQAVSTLTYGLVGLVQQSIQAARTADDFGRALEFASEKARTNTQENFQLAESLRSLGASRQEGRAAVTEAARFVEDIDPNGVERITRLGINIAASQGEGVDKADELIEQLRRGEDKFFKKRFGKTTTQLYREEGERSVLPGRDLFITDSKRDIRTDKQLVDDYVSSLSDLQKEKIRYNYLLTQESVFAGEAEKRSQTLAGRIDTLVNRYKDAQEGVGYFITEIKLLNSVVGVSIDLFERLAVSSGRIQKTGPGNTISGYDIEDYVGDRTNSTRSRVLNTVNNDLVPGVGALAGAGILAFLGKKGATQSYRQEVYNKEYSRISAETDIAGMTEKQIIASNKAAMREAEKIASQARPGFVRAVGEGTRKLTIGVQDATTGFIRSGYGALRGKEYGYRVYSSDRYNTTLNERRDNLQAGRSTGGTYGGALGAGVGAILGSRLAEYLQVGTLTAGVLTIAGGIAGDIVGTAIGAALGAKLTAGGLTTFAAGAASLGAGTVLGAGALGLIGTGAIAYSANERAFAERKVAIEEARSVAYGQQQTEYVKALNEGRVRYNSSRFGGGIGLTQQEVSTEIQTGRAAASDFYTQTFATNSQTGEVVMNLSPNSVVITAQEVQIMSQRKELLESLEKNRGLSDEGFQNTRDSFWQRVNQDNLKVDQENEQRREQAKQAFINRQAGGLNKLRETAYGSFRIVGDVAEALSPENDYVKVLSDGVTMSQRLNQQWGFLKDSTKATLLNLEAQKNQYALLNLRAATFAKTQELSASRSREVFQRNGRGLSTIQELGLGLFDARTSGQQQLRGAQQSIATYHGLSGTPYSLPDYVAKQSLKDLNFAYLQAYSQSGGSEELDYALAQKQIEIFNTPEGQQLVRRGSVEFQGDYIKALKTVGRGASQRTQDELQKIALQRFDQAQVTKDLADVQRSGIGSERIDKYILKRTEGIPVKDLTFQEFQQRQQAQQNEITRELKKETDAVAAIEAGLGLQGAILDELGGLRDDIVAGNLAAIIKIENDTQAEVDKSALQDANSGYKIPARGTPTRPYADQFLKYKRAL